MRKLILFLAAVSLVLFAEKALCYETTFSIEPESFNSFRYEEMRAEEAAPLSIRTGRFLSVDPTWESADLGKPQSWNRYSYVFNNPVNGTDPDGRLGVLDPEKARQRNEMIIGAVSKFSADFVLPDGHSDNSTTADKPDLAAAAASGAVVTAYQVGTVDKLRAESVPGDKLDIHHAPQAKPAGQVIPNYDPAKAPGMALPAQEHKAIPTQKGAFTGTPRDLLAKDVRDLRNNTNAPNSAIQKLVKLVKDTFVDAMKKIR